MQSIQKTVIIEKPNTPGLRTHFKKAHRRDIQGIEKRKLPKKRGADEVNEKLEQTQKKARMKIRKKSLLQF